MSGAACGTVAPDGGALSIFTPSAESRPLEDVIEPMILYVVMSVGMCELSLATVRVMSWEQKGPSPTTDAIIKRAHDASLEPRRDPSKAAKLCYAVESPISVKVPPLSQTCP